MKLGIFSDPHYSSAAVTCKRRYNSRSLRKMEEALVYFAREGCDRVICLGDLIDKEHDHAKECENLAAVAALFSRYTFPITVLRGNHDAFCLTESEFYGILGEETRPVTVKANGTTLLFLDACYFRDGTPYAPGHSDWRNTFLPCEDALDAALRAATGDVHLFLHQNVDPAVREDHRVANAQRIRAICEAHGNVRTVFQGHYHPGARSEHNGIRYVTLPAMCESDGAYETVEV